MSAQHTPGPWVLGPQNGHCGISIEECSQDQSRIATVYLGLVTSRCDWGDEHFALAENAEAIANARLIAAAPELLEALIKVVGCFDIKDGLSVRDEMAIKHATAIIAKATQP